MNKSIEMLAYYRLHGLVPEFVTILIGEFKTIDWWTQKWIIGKRNGIAIIGPVPANIDDMKYPEIVLPNKSIAIREDMRPLVDIDVIVYCNSASDIVRHVVKKLMALPVRSLLVVEFDKLNERCGHLAKPGEKWREI